MWWQTDRESKIRNILARKMNNPPPMMGYQPSGGTTVHQLVGTPQAMGQQLHQGVPLHQQQTRPPGLLNNAQQLLNQLGQNNNQNSNSLYHPHQNDTSLLTNPIWRLQLQLATVSRQSMGQANIYARQNAMKKYIMNQNSQVPQQSVNSNDLSTSLVDYTKQYLLEIAGEINGSLGTNQQQQSQSRGGDSDSTHSTPGTPRAELHGGTQNASSLLLQHKKLSQYNIDDDDEVEHRMVTPKDTKYDDQLWHALDLSNLLLFNLEESLFRYEFLTRLYLNGNNLTQLPPSVRQLHNLRVLDLSQNRLTELPIELGMCFQLKYLYFFDNMISSLPWEFGNLYNLQFLGCEGNPLDKHLIKILTEKSVTGLIFYLRDNAPTIPLSEDRKFIEISADGEPIQQFSCLQDSNKNLSREVLKRSFTVLSYNTLCQHYATPKMYRYTPSWALNWDYRRTQLKEQILNYETDIICLQEVEAKTYDEFWEPLLEQQGYSGIFHAKTRARTMQSKDSKKVDGCCVFYKSSEFKMVFKDAVDFSSVWMKHKKFQRTEDYLNRAMNKDNVALFVKLKHESTGEQFWITTTHLHWDPQFNDVKTFQVGVLLDYMEKLLKEQGGNTLNQDIKKIPLIICGDFNSQLGSAVVELFKTGSVNGHQDIHGRDFGFMSQKSYAHNLSLQSSYDVIGELPFTNFSATFTDVIDYIWYSTHSLRVRGLLGEINPSYISKLIGFPNDKFPSDHIPLVSRFEFIKNNTSSRKV